MWTYLNTNFNIYLHLFSGVLTLCLVSLFIFFSPNMYSTTGLQLIFWRVKKHNIDRGQNPVQFNLLSFIKNSVIFYPFWKPALPGGLSQENIQNKLLYSGDRNLNLNKICLSEAHKETGAYTLYRNIFRWWEGIYWRSIKSSFF